MSSIRVFLRDLRRRRLIEVAVIYAAAAWAIVGACDLLLPHVISDVDTAMPIVFAVAIMVAPIALIFGWLYDITEDGIQRTAPVSDSGPDPDTALRRRDHLLIGTLSAAVVAVVGIAALRISQLPPILQPAPENSIAVLPFDVCRNQDLDEALAAGLAMEVISQLSQRGKLQVAAPSAASATGDPDAPLQKTTKQLGVRYVLTGLLCRDGDTPTLSTELLDQTGFIAWNKRYELAANSSRQSSQSLAMAVANGVASFMGDVLATVADTPVNRLAHEQLLIGQKHRAQGDKDRALLEADRESLDEEQVQARRQAVTARYAQARAAFERALKHQPDYAEALYEMAVLDVNTSPNPGSGEDLRKARTTAENALALVTRQLGQHAGSAQLQIVAGNIVAALARWDRALTLLESGQLGKTELAARKAVVADRYAEAEGHFRAALKLNPGRTELYARLADVIEGQGPTHHAVALEVLEQAQAEDPFNPEFNWRIARHRAARGHFRQAIELLQRFEAMPTPPAEAWWWQLELMQQQAYWDEKCAKLIVMLQQHPDAFENANNRGQAWLFVGDLASLGLDEEAAAWKARIENMPMADETRKRGLENYLGAAGRYDEESNDFRARLAAMSEDELRDAFHAGGHRWATNMALAGKPERAIELMESIRHTPDIWIEGEIDAAMALAVLYQEVGREDDAGPLLQEVLDYLKAEHDSGILHPNMLAKLAEAYARKKRDIEALDTLRKAVDQHYRVPCDSWWREDQLSPPWLRFKNDFRMTSLCQRMQVDLEQQAERIRTMLAEHDIDELLAPLMAMAEQPTKEAAD